MTNMPINRMLAGDTRVSLCFMHIGKVGGHSISKELLNRFDISETYNGSPEQFDVLDPSELAGKKLIIGHFSFCHVKKLPRERFLFSIVRDPIDRVISNYWYLRSYQGALTDTNSEMVRLAKSYPFDDFIRLPDLQVRQVVENHQCLFFAGDWRSENRSSDHLIRMAIEHLDHFDLIGLHEEYDDSLQLLAASQSWFPWPSETRLNTTPFRQSIDSISPDALQYLRQSNRLDIELYQIIKERYVAQRRELLHDLVRHKAVSRIKEQSDRPSFIQLDATQPFPGEGWHERMVVGGRYARWMGPREEATLILRLNRSRGATVDVHISGWMSPKAVEQLALHANGGACERTRCDIAGGEDIEQRRAIASFSLPPSADPTCELRFKTIPPQPLTAAGYPDAHSRLGSIAVSTVYLRQRFSLSGTALIFRRRAADILRRARHD